MFQTFVVLNVIIREMFSVLSIEIEQFFIGYE